MNSSTFRFTLTLFLISSLTNSASAQPAEEAPQAIIASASPIAVQTYPADQQEVVTPELLLSDYASPLGTISEVGWFPDGGRLVFAAEARRLRGCAAVPERGDDDEGASTVWIVVLDTNTGNCRPLVPGRQPIVSPDGRLIAYLAGTGAETRIAVIDADGGAPRELTPPDAGLALYYFGLGWSPDGTRIAYGYRPEDARETAAAPAPGESSVVVIGGEGDLPPDSELWLVDIATGERRKLFNAPANFTDVAWFPDGGSVAFVQRGSFEYRTDGFEAQVRAVDVTSGAVRTLVEDAGVQGLEPAISPDGSRIAFMYDPNNIYYPYYYRVATISVTGGEITPLTENLWVDGGAVWAPDSRTLFFEGKPGAFTQIFTVSLSGTPRQVTDGPREVSGIALSPDGRTLAWTARDLYGRIEIRTARADGRAGPAGSDERVLLDLTSEIDELALSEAEAISWESTDGLEIFGFLIKPLNYEPGKRYPLIVDLHGGPLGGTGLAGRVLLTTPLEWQMWAARGYAVLHADYRSSGIYGWDVLLEMRENQDDLERDFDDIMAGVDHVLALGIADPERLAVIGHSAGAYRTNWLITHTDRFDAAVSYEGVADRFLGYGTGSRVGGNVALEWHFNGKPWEVPENYRNASPIEYVAGVTTPTMFVSGRDGIALFHNEFLYSAWKVQGVPVEFLVYGGEGHVISRAENQRDLLMRVIDWIDRWFGHDDSSANLE